MTKKLAFLLAAAVAFCFPAPAKADVGIVSASGSITATDTNGLAGSQLALTGQNQCQVTFAGTFTGITVVGQVSGDYPIGTNGAYHWSTASSPLASMSVTNGATFIGNVSATGLTGWQLHVTAYGTGTAYWFEVCSPASGASSGGGGGSVTQGTTPWLVAGQGTAGSPGTAVLTVQGIGSGTAVPVSGTIACSNCGSPYSMATQGQTGTGASGIGVLCGYFSSPPTLTNGQVNPCALDAVGNALVNVNVALPAGTNSLGTVGLNTGTNRIGLVSILGSNSSSASLLSDSSNRQIIVGPGTGAAPAGGVLSVSPTVPLFQQAISANVVTATTTVLVTHSGTTLTYIYGAYEQATATQSAATIKFEYGTGTNCGSGTVVLQATGITATVTSGDFTGYGLASATVPAPPATSSNPVAVIPASNDFCVVTAGTTTAATFYTTYIQQ